MLNMILIVEMLLHLYNPSYPFKKLSEVQLEESQVMLAQPKLPVILDDSLIAFISGQSDLLIYNYHRGTLHAKMQLSGLNADSLVFALFATHYHRAYQHIAPDDAYARANRVAIKGFGFDAGNDRFIIVAGLQSKYLQKISYQGDSVEATTYGDELIMLMADNNLNIKCLIPFYADLPNAYFPMVQGHWFYSGDNLMCTNLVVRSLMKDTPSLHRFLTFQIADNGIQYTGPLSGFFYQADDAHGSAFLAHMQFCNYKNKTLLAAGNKICDMNGAVLADASGHGKLEGFTLQGKILAFEATTIDSARYTLGKVFRIEGNQTDSLTIGLSAYNTEAAFYKNRFAFIRLSGEQYHLLTYEIL